MIIEVTCCAEVLDKSLNTKSAALILPSDVTAGNAICVPSLAKSVCSSSRGSFLHLQGGYR